MRTLARKEARVKLAELVDWAWEGDECLDVLVSEFGEWLREFCSPSSPHGEARHQRDGIGELLEDTDLKIDRKHSPEVENLKQDARNESNKGQDIKRTLLWSHHLLATSKRKIIIDLSRELRLGGYSRPGYPGAIFVEGVTANVDDFVRRIKGLRWQALQVRSEQRSSRRVCGEGLEGVTEVERLGEVVEGLRKTDERVATLFLEGMRIAH